MVVLVTCKDEVDSIKNEGARVDTPISINFYYVQGQRTPYLVMGSGLNSNAFKLLCLTLLTARMKKFL